MVMRRLGAFEETACFAVLLANAFSPLLDIFTNRVTHFFSDKTRKKEAFENV
jgi:Na+-translocating ferredoxin:NAD+ oxidoreductase RnfD subunit